jgi:hypothetical protein
LNSTKNLSGRKKRDESALIGKDECDFPKASKEPRLASDKKKLVYTYCKSKGNEAQECWLNPDSPKYRPELVEKLDRAAAAAANARQQQDAPQEENCLSAKNSLDPQVRFEEFSAVTALDCQVTPQEEGEIMISEQSFS